MDVGNDTRTKSGLSDSALVATGVYLVTAGLLAFVGNAFVIIVMVWGKPSFIKAQKVLMLSIAVSDLTITCTGYPVTAVSGFHKRWIFNESVCVFSGFVVFLLTLANINALTAMSVVRYIVVCKPELTYLLKDKYPKYILLLIWGYSLVWTACPLFGWGGFGKEPFGTSCTLTWTSRRRADVTYNVACIVVCYVLQVTVIFCFYTATLKAVSGMSKHEVSKQIAEAHQRGVSLDKLRQYKKVISVKQMSTVCFVMIMGFLICWTPYAVLTAWATLIEPVSSEVIVLPTMFAKASCLINPIIYACSSDNFREAAMRLFRRASARVEPIPSIEIRNYNYNEQNIHQSG